MNEEYLLSLLPFEPDREELREFFKAKKEYLGKKNEDTETALLLAYDGVYSTFKLMLSMHKFSRDTFNEAVRMLKEGVE